MRDAFAAAGHALSPDAVIVIAGTEGNSWFITDHSVLYAINKDGTTGGLRVTSFGRQTKAAAKELECEP